MTKKIDIRVRQVHRYIVTKFEQADDTEGCSSMVGEFPSACHANMIAMALYDTSRGRVAARTTPDQSADIRVELWNDGAE